MDNLNQVRAVAELKQNMLASGAWELNAATAKSPGLNQACHTQSKYMSSLPKNFKAAFFSLLAQPLFTVIQSTLLNERANLDAT